MMGTGEKGKGIETSAPRAVKAVKSPARCAKRTVASEESAIGARYCHGAAELSTRPRRLGPDD